MNTSSEENEMLIEEIKCCQTDEEIHTLVDSQCFDLEATTESEQLKHAHYQLFRVIKLFRDQLKENPQVNYNYEKEMDDILSETGLLHLENTQQKNKITQLSRELGTLKGDMNFVCKLTLPQLQATEEQLLKSLSAVTNQKNNLITLAEQKRMETKLCVICYSQPYSVMFKPCGHVCVCDGCSMKIDKCPIDRMNIKKIKRVYLS